LYQSLEGINYTLDSSNQQLIRLSKDTKNTINFNILLEDTCFTEEGKFYHRLVIDKMLDERFKSKEVQNTKCTEFVQNQQSHTLLVSNIIKKNKLEKEYKELVEKAKKFNKSYIHMKGNEILYANKCKALCNKFDLVIMSLMVDI